MRSSIQPKWRVSRRRSLYCSAPPNSMRARRRASPGERPERTRSAARASRWKASSSCISRSRRRRSTSFRSQLGMSDLLGGGREGSGHGVDQLAPGLGLLAQALAAGGSEAVKLGAAVVFRGSPFGREQPLEFEAVESGIECALLDLERAAGDLADAQEDAVAVESAEGDGFEDQDVESAGEEGGD